MKIFCGLIVLSEAIQRYPQDRQLPNLDERLLEIDIASHGYAPKAVKKCGIRYMGPSFYVKWKTGKADDGEGNCVDPEVDYAKENVSKNPEYWVLASNPIIKQTVGGNLLYNFHNTVKDGFKEGFNVCAGELIENNARILPYCHIHQGLRLYDLRGYGDRYLAEGSQKCVEAYMYHFGPELMHGVFFDTSSTRSMVDNTNPNTNGPLFAPEKEQEDLDEIIKVVEFTRNFWRDNILDDEAIVIANSGNRGSSGQLMKAKIDSVTLKEHYIESYPNFYTGVCPDADPKWENDLRCVNWSLESYNNGVRKWREELYQLIKYGPLDPQAQFVQGWHHPDTPELIESQFGKKICHL